MSHNVCVCVAMALYTKYSCTEQFREGLPMLEVLNYLQAAVQAYNMNQASPAL